jgi:excinuclease ABC subunit C
MALLVRLRDEVHDTAIRYHRKLRQKATKHSLLDDIPGVGPKRRTDLLKRFGSVEGLRQASAAQLSEVPGISPALARRITSALTEAP